MKRKFSLNILGASSLHILTGHFTIWSSGKPGSLTGLLSGVGKKTAFLLAYLRTPTRSHGGKLLSYLIP